MATVGKLEEYDTRLNINAGGCRENASGQMSVLPCFLHLLLISQPTCNGMQPLFFLFFLVFRGQIFKPATLQAQTYRAHMIRNALCIAVRIIYFVSINRMTHAW